ncbi:MAG: AmmeMemoRadiSam system radical SAM enzyme [Thermofilaceae archaeon]|nr:AmmeMemoRadiSam system radical SAM enzyme [Thermofilaceae archaeon]MDW8003778.1 AmmeMemoRadiSam system radical SAM enzyme [Thermofilaceae archaeon]
MSSRAVREAKWYEKLSDGKVRCRLCPWNCVLEPGRVGLCGVRMNREGSLFTLVYGLVSSLAIDPIEKKPLYHFYPGAPILSISTVGCNLKCPWCQNWHISRAKPEEALTEYLEPSMIVKLARRYDVPFVAYTYNEPLIWYEYVADTAKLVKQEGGFNVLVTNGHANPEPLEELLKYIDAANVDVKAFEPKTYLKIIGGKLENILESIKIMKEKDVHVETTYLVVPGINDNEEEFRKMVRWHIDELGPETPLHISRFFPAYKFADKNSTPTELLTKFWALAKSEGVYYVYLGNVPGHKGEYTFCSHCEKPVVKRMGFEIFEWNIEGGNKCKFCGATIHIRGERWRRSSRDFPLVF